MMLDSKTTDFPYSKSQLWFMVLLRVVIGWHFLYEGIAKLMSPGWSSMYYLLDSKGWFAPLFHSLAGNADLLPLIDFLNVWGLICIGLGLILGAFSKLAAICGAVLTFIYYLSHPPFVGLEFLMPSEGSYLWVDKNIIEIFALLVVFVFPTSRIIGLDVYLYRLCPKRKVSNKEKETVKA